MKKLVSFTFNDVKLSIFTLDQLNLRGVIPLHGVLRDFRCNSQC